MDKPSKLERWLTLVANLAVVLGIVFLWLELRQNTSSIQAQTYQELIRQVNDYRVLLLEHAPERADARAKWRAEGFESLTSAEQGLFELSSEVIWGIYEAAYFANRRGVLGRREWTRFEEGICRNRVAQDEVWNPTLLTAEFVDYVDTHCG